MASICGTPPSPIQTQTPPPPTSFSSSLGQKLMGTKKKEDWRRTRECSVYLELASASSRACSPKSIILSSLCRRGRAAHQVSSAPRPLIEETVTGAQ